MRFDLIAFGTVLALTPCTGAEAGLDAETDAALKNVAACNVDASKEIADQQGDPVSLAIAAYGMCAPQVAALSDAYSKRYPPSTVSQLIDRLRTQSIDRNAATIVMQRAQ